MRFRGLVYRALNLVWAARPLSGEGARRHGGRFNPRGVPALYTATRIMGAVREASQVGLPLQPTTLVSYAADVDPVLDGRDPAALAPFGMTPAALADPGWRLAMRQGEAPTQSFARAAVAAGFAGLLVPSHAAGAGPADLNLVLWRWGAERPARLILNDAEGRLGPGG